LHKGEWKTSGKEARLGKHANCPPTGKPHGGGIWGRTVVKVNWGKMWRSKKKKPVGKGSEKGKKVLF